MKDIVKTTAVIAAISAGIVLAMMAPKGFEFGPPDPIVTSTELAKPPEE